MKLIVFLFVLITNYFTGATNFLECETQADCMAPEATCSDNLCECPTGMIFSIDGTKCLEVVLRYGDPCTDDAQCSPLLGKNECKFGACQCQTGYRYYHGICIPAVGLGKPCSKDEDCFVSHDLFAMVCSSFRCDCNNGYYARGGYDCRPLAKEFGDTCALDSDCQLLKNSICNNGCILKSKSRVNLLKEERNYTTLHRVTRNIVDDCVSNEDCVDKANSYCSQLTKKCVCKRGYYSSKNVCVGELGLNVGCTQNSDCSTSPKLCKDGMCICPTSHYYGPGLDKCVKAASKVNNKFKCNSNQACSVLGLKAECVAENDVDSFCECNYGTELNEDFLCSDTEECVTGCEEDEECDIINSICQRGECVCPSNYRLEEDICLPNLGGACDETSRRCEMGNSECGSNAKCSCKEGYLELDSTTCIKRAGVNEECSLPQQCTWDNTDCIKGVCQCKTGFQEIGGLCVQARAMGDYCTNIMQCHVALGQNVMCRNSKCQCASDAQPLNNKLDCRPRSASSSIHQYRKKIFLLSTFLVSYLFKV